MRILKKYSEFVNRINENEEPMLSPEEMDNFTEDQIEMDSEMEMDSNMIEDEDEFTDEFEDQVDDDMEEEMEEEEEGEYMGTRLMAELAEKLGTEVVDNKVEYNGTEINFFSEDEKFHIGKNKFETVDEVLEFLTGAGGSVDDIDTEDGMTGTSEVETVVPEPMEDPFESKNFKYLNKFKI
jgi:hypothetical protein